MYAVIETGGKQYRVQQGDVLSIEKLGVEAGEKVTFDKVLVVNDGTGVSVGAPCVAGASVNATVVENGKGKKVVIFKYKAKKDYRKKQGHRQPYTMVQIDEITVDGKVISAPAQEKTADASEQKADKVNLKAMKKAELIEYAKENNIEVNEKAVKDEIIAVIEAAEE